MHQLNIDKNEGESGIVYDNIFGCDLMVKLGISADFKRQVLQWDGATVPMKEPRGLLGQTYLTSSEMREVLMQTAEPVSRM